MAITQGDVVFSREGKPVTVTSKDKSTGNVTVDKNFERVQAENKSGIRNGLDPSQKTAYKAILSDLQSPDKQAEIDLLAKKIDELKKSNVDPRVLRYLESELKHRMSRERYQPDTYQIDPTTLITY